MKYRDVHPKVEEAVETLSLPPLTRRRLLRGTGLSSAALAASALLSACVQQQDDGKEEAAAGVGDFPETPEWNFAFVNHVTTNPFFQPTQYGAADACALLNCRYQWQGSEDSVITEMVNATQSAVSSQVDGLAIAVVDVQAFAGPVDQALQAGIPVVSYNADGATDNPGTNRLAYIGQDLFLSGHELGTRIAELVPSGDVVGFIATPGQLNIQPRIDGAQQAIRESGKQINFEAVATGAELPEELNTIRSYAQGHPNLAGMLAVDAGSTQGMGQVVAELNLRDRGLRAAGGFDLLDETLRAIQDGHLDFTIDQQPYLQGFLPVLYLYLYKLSGGLLSPSDTNTGLLFVTQDNVEPYLSEQTRYQGNSEEQRLVERSGPISV